MKTNTNMSPPENAASETVGPVTRMRLTLDVDYRLNGESPELMAEFLRVLCDHAASNGMLTRSSHAEVETWDAKAVQLPEPLSEEELAGFMLQRIENGQLALEDIPVRLARYGLEEPHNFVNEMRERMENTNGD